MRFLQRNLGYYVYFKLEFNLNVGVGVGVAAFMDVMKLQYIISARLIQNL